jgi:hypothetical protein
VLVGLFLVGTVPYIPAQAQIIDDFEFFDNNQSSFADGVFQRSALSADVLNFGDDVRGAVQLAPAGILNPWRPGLIPLPTPLFDFGFVALDKYLFAVAGSDPNSTTAGRSNKVYIAEVDQRIGQLKVDEANETAWRSVDIPAGPLNRNPNCSGEQISARTRAAVTSVEAPASRRNQGILGYIYIIGGNATSGCAADITTSLVQIATVSTTGTITSWSTLSSNDLPNAFNEAGEPSQFLGIEGAMATIVRASGVEPRTFLYVFGGISINPFNDLRPNRISRQAIYARIDPNTGALQHPTNSNAASPWALALPEGMPLEEGTNGLYSGVALTSRLTRTVTDTTTNPPSTAIVTSEVIYIAGGCTNEQARCSNNSIDRLNEAVYRAEVNPTTGQLTWDATPGDNGASGVPVALEARSGQAGLSYGNKLYLIGGSSTGDAGGAKNSIPTAFLTNAGKLERIDSSGDSFFVGPDEQVLTTGLPGDNGTRVGLGAAIVPALPPLDENSDPDLIVNAAWAFVAGGTRDNGLHSATIFVGRLGGADESQATIRLRDGWYYSNAIPIDIGGATARVIAVRWQADIDRTLNPDADMIFEFRKTITATGLCAEDSFSTTNPADRWRLVDGDPDSEFFSRTGTPGDPYNLIEMDKVFEDEQVNATCLQYRVQFLQNGGAAPQTASASPKLLNFSLKRVLAGSPDLRLKADDGFTISAPNGRFRDLRVTIANLKDTGLEDTWDVSAYLAITDPQAARGNFFVNLCVERAEPGAANFPTLDVPTPLPPRQPGEPAPTPPACSVAYAAVSNTIMTKGAEVTLTGWRSNETNEPIDLREIFREPGRYTVGVVIDYYNVIPEGPNGTLNNRGEDEQNPNGLQFNIDISGSPEFTISLPVIQN